MHTSLPITRSEEHKHVWLRVEAGEWLSLEARQRAECEHARLEAEDETHLVEQARLKAEEEEYSRLDAGLKSVEEKEDSRLKAEKEARLADEEKLKTEEADQAQMRDDKEALLAK